PRARARTRSCPRRHRSRVAPAVTCGTTGWSASAQRGATLPVGPAYGCRRGMVGPDGDVVVLVLERLVHLDQRLLLGLGDAGVAEDLAHHVVLAGALLEDARPYVEGLGRDAQRLRDLLEDLGRGLPQSALDLAQVGVADARHVGELAERQPGHPPLLADELAEVVHASLELVLDVGHRANCS